MSNKLALYKDPEVVALVNKWFHSWHGNDFHREGEIITLPDLYQSYCEYTLPIDYLHYRMDANMFAKCVAAAKIIDIGGRWRYAENHTPSRYEITRATA